MPSKNDPCRVCGAVPTVNCHLLPRAFAHDLRAGDKHVHLTSKDEKGTIYSQSGIAYHGILCRDHEEALHAFDDYGVKLVRQLEQDCQGLPDSQSLIFDNPDPAKLQRFALACIWRTVNSQHGDDYRLSLGPYEGAFRASLFNDESCTIPATMSLTRLTLPGIAGRAPLVMLPFRARMKGLTCWQFIIGRIVFYVICDKRPALVALDPARADREKRVVLTNLDPLPMNEWKPMKPFIANMSG